MDRHRPYTAFARPFLLSVRSSIRGDCGLRAQTPPSRTTAASRSSSSAVSARVRVQPRSLFVPSSPRASLFLPSPDGGMRLGASFARGSGDSGRPYGATTPRPPSRCADFTGGAALLSRPAASPALRGETARSFVSLRAKNTGWCRPTPPAVCPNPQFHSPAPTGNAALVRQQSRHASSRPRYRR